MITADIILKSNAIYVGEGDNTISGYVAVKDNRILAVSQDINSMTSDNTKVYDFGDKLIIPGFIDAHAHSFMGADLISKYMCSEIGESTSEAEAVEMIKKFADDHPDYNRIRGFGWFPANWNDAPLPTKHSLDAVISDRPVYLNCADGHSMWLNSKALEEAQITPDMKFANGRIGVDENGEMDGMIYEVDACFKVIETSSQMPKEITKEIIINYMKELAKSGVTSISEMSADSCGKIPYEKYSILKEMDEEGTLSSRINIYMALFGKDDYDDVLEYQNIFKSNHLKIGGLKGFADGVTSTYTGLLLEPYTDKPETCGEGVPLMTQEEMNNYVVRGNKEGLPVRIHCIASGSIRMALDAFEESVKENGKDGKLPFYNTIEHIETIHPDDIPRFEKLGVIASVQPAHFILDGNEKITRCGPERCRWEWPHKSLINSNAQLAFGSDFPVVSYDPFIEIYSAVTRCDYDGKPTGIGNDEYMTVAQCLSAYTAGSAKAYNMFDELGTLEEGKLADIVVIDRNLFKIDPKEILDAKVELTMVDGKIIYERS